MSIVKMQQPNKKPDEVDFSLNSEDITSFALSVPNEAQPTIETTLKKPVKEVKTKGTTAKQKKEKPDNASKTKLPRLPYKLVAPPDGLPVVEYSIQPTKVVCFSGSNHFLSSFYKAQFEMNGIRYQSVEHYYQATKLYALCGYETAAKIQFVREPFKAKQLAKEVVRRYRIPYQAIETWKRTDGLVTLIYAVALKFIQNKDLREKLLNTRDSILVQTHAGDNFYAAAMDKPEFEKWIEEHVGQILKLPYAINEYTLKHFPLTGKGQNLLGGICMRVRSELASVSIADLYDRTNVNRILMKLIN